MADYEAVKDFYEASGLIDTYDAAVISRTPTARSRSSRSTSSRPGRAPGAAWASAWSAGRWWRCSRPSASGGALLAGGAGGGALGALAGHVAGGMSRGDLKDLGELLDDGRERTGRGRRDGRGGARREAISRGGQAGEEATAGRPEGPRGGDRRRRQGLSVVGRSGCGRPAVNDEAAGHSDAVTCGSARGQGRGRTADLPLFRRTLVPTELPARARRTIQEPGQCSRAVSREATGCRDPEPTYASTDGSRAPPLTPVATRSRSGR